MTRISLPSAGEPGITLDRVSFSYGEVPIVSGVSWELDLGKSAVITGGSGCGKSTLLQIAAGLLPPLSGSVLLGGHPMKRLSPSERVRRGLRTGFVFQEGGLLANMDVYSNVSLALDYHRDILGLDEAGLKERTEEALEAAQIAKMHWSTIPAHLSFGDRKRLALARAIALKPNFFYFDDPDVGMDHLTSKVTHQFLCSLRDDPEVTLLVATNRTALIERLGVPGFRMAGGQILTAGMVSAFPPAPGM